MIQINNNNSFLKIFVIISVKSHVFPALILLFLIFCVSGKINAQSNHKNINDSAIFKIAEQMPVFTYKNKTGIEGFRDFYRDSLKYPQIQDCEGRVIIKCIIEKDATITNIKVLRDIPGCPEYNEEALRVTRLMNGFWTTGISENRKVRTEMIFPVTFK